MSSPDVWAGGWGFVSGLGPAAGPAEIGEAVRRDVAAFAGDAEASDDMAIVVLRYTGAT